MLLPCTPGNHATMRNRTHRAAADLEAAASPAFEPAQERPTEITTVIDGAHIRAAHAYQSRHVDVTVGKIEVAGRPPRRFALAPKRFWLGDEFPDRNFSSQANHLGNAQIVGKTGHRVSCPRRANHGAWARLPQ